MGITYGSYAMELDRKRFGLDVTRARLDAGLTQADVAVLCGASDKWVSAVERAEERVLTIRTYEILCNALDLRPDHYWVLADFSG